MDDSFRGRVEKIFGSLSSSQPSSALNPLWSLTDEEVERREWNRHKDDPDRDDETPCSSSFDGLFKKDRKNIGRNSRGIRKELEDLNDVDDDDVDDGQFGGGLFKRGDVDNNDDDRDEWVIRSSIGLDCTLDNEEEEDAYDKMAEGKENIGDRLYMKDVTDHGPYLNSHNVLPNSVHDAPRDPRANHHAAKIRLKEDESVALGSYQTCDESMLNGGGPFVIASEVGVKVKSILKRKKDTAFKSSKRVRFDPNLKDDYEEASEKIQDALADLSSTGTKAEGDDDSVSVDNERRVPDYIFNPSKYTHYSFDSSSVINEESNSQGYMDFVEHIKTSKPIALEQDLEDSSADLPKSVIFVPRKKASDGKPVISSSEGKLKQSFNQAGFAIGIAAGEVQQGEVCVMQEDEPDIDAACTNASIQKTGRRYRTKSRSEDNVS